MVLIPLPGGPQNTVHLQYVPCPTTPLGVLEYDRMPLRTAFLLFLEVFECIWPRGTAECSDLFGQKKFLVAYLLVRAFTVHFKSIEYSTMSKTFSVALWPHHKAYVDEIF